ncbi:MAG TPA: arylsulfatase [Caulobacteraceae bacterium]|nr:arylsulfatase [Caulobacteraceae bacterium]
MTKTTPSGEPFGGVIGRTLADSQPWWPEPKLKAGAPDVVVVVLDDTGFAHLGCYGSTIETPNMDALAAGGLRFTGFHTTALCSPTRACLMTGRNHHAVGMRAISNFDTGFPNMRGALPKSAATLPEILRENGYATFAAGKWHLAPMAECTAAGPFANWPLQKGFDRYYGFLQGETDQFHPELTSDNHFVDPPTTAERGYHFSEDVVDKACGMVRDVTSLVPERPFFLYLAFGAMHSPHQAPQAYLDKYRGRFDGGWDEARDAWFARQKAMGVVPEDTRLAPRNRGVHPWTELSDNQRAFAARLQEAFAAMLDHTDAQIGRLIDFLKSIERWENTLFILLSDNGASQEGGQAGVLDEMKWFNGLRENVDEAVLRLDDIGGPNSHCNIPWGWAQAGNTPLKWYKQNTHGGGVRDPLIVSWPAGLTARGEMRHQFCHAIDLAPTVLDVVGIAPPEVVGGVPQMPIDGKSLKGAMLDASTPLPRGPQYFEMLGHRGIVADGWKAVTHHEAGKPFEEDRWELYRFPQDFSEYEDLAASEPDRLKAMQDVWWSQAERYGVLPLDDRTAMALFRASMRPGMPTARLRYTYRPPVSHIVADACPPAARGWTMTVDLTHPTGHGDGALAARGSRNSGFVLYVKEGRVNFDYNFFHEHTRLAAAMRLTPGRHIVELSVARLEGGAGHAALAVDGQTVAESPIPRLLYMMSSTGMDLGRSLAPVNDDYVGPFVYPGEIHTIVFQLPAQAPPAGEVRAQVRAEMVRQ